MPLYEYRCSDCRSTFELLVNYRHADDIICVKCHSEKVRRLLSTFAPLHHNSEDAGYDDAPPAMGSCGCGGGCGCN